jgi:dephospho-CoA kinase
MPNHILGIVGTPGSGKSYVTEYIINHYGGDHFRFSDFLSHVLTKMNLPQTRENMIKMSVSLRSEFGDDLFSHAVAAEALRSEADLVLVDGIRRLGDLAAFRPMPNFTLIGVNADAKLRYERMKKRGEKATETNMTWEQFEQEEKAPTEVTIPETMTYANETILNDGTRDELDAKIDGLMKKLGFEKPVMSHES